MKTDKLLAIIAVVWGLSLFSGCVDNNPAVATGDYKKNPVITGKLFNTDGTISLNANVNIRLKDTVPKPLGGIIDTNSSRLFTTKTDNTGTYSFDAVFEPGMYVIDAYESKNAARIDSIEIKKSNESISLPDAILKPAGAIKGIIRAGENDSGCSGYVLAFGTNKFSRTNRDGSFFVSNLAEGRYKLRIIPDLKEFGLVDTGYIEVISAETTDIGSIQLPGDEKLVPQKVKLSFDTLQQVVTLSWNKISDLRVKRYLVYRMNCGVDEKYFKLFTSIDSEDTLCVDSLCIQDKTYEYYIVSLTKNNVETDSSRHCKVTIASNITLDTIYNNVISPEELLLDFTVSPRGTIYLPLLRSNKIEIRDSSMILQSVFAGGISQYHGIRCDNSHIYLGQMDVNNRCSNLLLFSESGEFIDTIFTGIKYMLFDVGFGSIATAFLNDTTDSANYIHIYSTDGTLKSSWKYQSGFRCRKVILAGENEVLLFLQSSSDSYVNKIITHSIDGTLISEKEVSYDRFITNIAYDAKKQYLYLVKDEFKPYRSNLPSTSIILLMSRIDVYDKNFKLIACYKVFNGGPISSIALNDDGNLYIVANRGAGVDRTGPRIIKLNPVSR
jgi:hypothetical protein